MHTLRILNLNDPRAAFRNFLLAAAALITVTIAALIPNRADAGDFNFGDTEELLEELIEMDAGDIEELQGDLADARAEIADAIVEIEDARQEVKEAPGGAAIANIAFKAAQVAVKTATGKALHKARNALNEVEIMLDDRRSEVGEAEYRETRDAIAMIRGELTEIEYALDELSDALRGA